MRKTAYMATVAVLLLPAAAEARPEYVTAQAAAPCSGKTFTIRAYRKYAGRVYRRDQVSRRAHRRMAVMRRCGRSRHARRWVRRWHRRYVRERRARQEAARREAAATPYGPFAIPPHIVNCESDSWTDVNTSNPERPAGRYQITTSTWLAYGGGQFAPTADLATPVQQSIIAARIWAGGRGRGHWEC